MLCKQVPIRLDLNDLERAISTKDAPTQPTLDLLKAEIHEKYLAYRSNSGHPKENTPMSLSDVSIGHLKDNYTLTYKGRKLQEIRSHILRCTFKGLCCLCGRAPANGLDHYLPKEIYPEFSIFVHNLVPCCASCNSAKGKNVGSERARFLHVYFEDVSEFSCWLTCRFENDSRGLFFQFSVSNSLPIELHANASHHFDRLHLAEAYRMSANAEIGEIEFLLREAAVSQGAKSVAHEIRRMETSVLHTYGEHYWKVALYRGMLESADFLNGGYTELSQGR